MQSGYPGRAARTPPMPAFTAFHPEFVVGTVLLRFGALFALMQHNLKRLLTS